MKKKDLYIDNKHFIEKHFDVLKSGFTYIYRHQLIQLTGLTLKHLFILSSAYFYTNYKMFKEGMIGVTYFKMFKLFDYDKKIEYRNLKRNGESK